MERLRGYTNTKKKLQQHASRLAYLLDILSSQYKFENATLDAVLSEKLYDRSYIEEDDSNIKLLQDSHVQVVSLHGKGKPGLVEAQVNLSTRLGLEDGILTYVDVVLLWRNCMNQLTVFTGHGCCINDRFALYLEVFRHNQLSVSHFPIQEYWLQWWNFICVQNLFDRNAILVLDMCHSGAVIPEFNAWLGSGNIRADLAERRCAISVQASCLKEEFSKGAYFLSAWLHSFRNPNDAVELLDDADLPLEAFEQHPVFATSSTSVRGNTLDFGGKLVTFYDDARSLYSCWRRLKQVMCTVTRPRPNKSMVDLVVGFLSRKGGYCVVDVRPFKSGVRGYEYQLVAVLKSIPHRGEEHLIWNQHMHLDSASLAHGVWTVASDISARIVEVLPIQPEKDHEFRTYVYQDDDQYADRIPEVFEPVEEVGVGEIGLTTNEAGHVLASKSNFRVVEQNRQKAKTSILFSGKLAPTARTLIRNIQEFMRQRPQQLVYAADVGRFMELSEWFAGATNDEQLPLIWSLATSIQGITRVRSVGVVFGRSTDKSAVSNSSNSSTNTSSSAAHSGLVSHETFEFENVVVRDSSTQNLTLSTLTNDTEIRGTVESGDEIGIVNSEYIVQRRRGRKKSKH